MRKKEILKRLEQFRKDLEKGDLSNYTITTMAKCIKANINGKVYIINNSDIEYVAFALNEAKIPEFTLKQCIIRNPKALSVTELIRSIT